MSADNHALQPQPHHMPRREDRQEYIHALLNLSSSKPRIKPIKLMDQMRMNERLILSVGFTSSMRFQFATPTTSSS